jgi:hypothetical protein
MIFQGRAAGGLRENSFVGVFMARLRWFCFPAARYRYDLSSQVPIQSSFPAVAWLLAAEGFLCRRLRGSALSLPLPTLPASHSLAFRVG